MTDFPSAVAESRSEVAAAEKARRAGLAKKKDRAGGLQNGHPATSEMDYTADDVEFMRAVGDWQVSTGRRFPTWSEVAKIFRSLGYCKDAPAGRGEPSES